MKIVSLSMLVLFSSLSVASAADLTCVLKEEVVTKSHRILGSTVTISGDTYTKVSDSDSLLTKGSVDTYKANAKMSKALLEDLEKDGLDNSQSKLLKRFAEIVGERDGYLIIEENGDHPTVLVVGKDNSAVALNLKYDVAQSGKCE